MWILSAVGTVLMAVKTAVTYVAVALTALVAAGNELRRWPLVFRYLEGRQIALRRAWGSALLLYFLLAVAYAWVEHRTDVLVVDCLGIVVMVSTVVLLAQRRSLREVQSRGADAPAEPREADSRRKPRAGKLVDVDEDGDDSLSPTPGRSRRRRRVPRD